METKYTDADLNRLVLKMTRQTMEDVMHGQGVFIDALAQWFVNMLDDPPGFALKQAEHVEESVARLLRERRVHPLQREHALRFARGLRVRIVRILEAQGP